MKIFATKILEIPEKEKIGVLCAFVAMLSFLSISTTMTAGQQNKTVLSGTQKPSRQQRKPNEYLVTVKANAGEAEVWLAFSQFQVRSVTKIADRVFQVVLGEDPGPEKIKDAGSLSKDMEAVQPNFIYRAF